VRVFCQEPRSTAQPHSHWPANPTSFHYVHLHFSRSLYYTEVRDIDSSENFVDLSIYEFKMRHIPDDENLHQQCLRTSHHAHMRTLIYNFEHASVKLKDPKCSLRRKNDHNAFCIRETATTRSFVLWLFLNNHDAG
jgi:hypothetical protein